MKSLAAFALVILSCAPAMAQRTQPQSPSIEIELLEMEQDVDKTVLREALMLQSRMGMKAENNLSDKEADALSRFIAKKKSAITARSAELSDKQITSGRTAKSPVNPFAKPGRPANSPINPSAKPDRQAALEKLENAQVESQLLQAQVNLFQKALSKAITEAASAEFAASSDESQRAKAEEARKEYEQVKAKYVDHSKRMKLELQEVQSLQQSLGMAGFGGGFR